MNAWAGFLGGTTLHERAGRRITIAVVVATALVLVVGFFAGWGWRPTLAGLLMVQAAAIVARLHVARSTYVHVDVADDGVRITRSGRFVRFFSYHDISTTVDDGADVCIVLEDGQLLRVGIDDDDAERRNAVRTMQTAWARTHTRRSKA
jgi:hypothetical protein